LKPKEELIKELDKMGIYYRQVFNNISIEDKKLVYKSLKNDKFFETKIDEFDYPDSFDFDQISTIFYNKENIIVGITCLDEMFVHDVSGNFYSIFGYTIKSQREKNIRLYRYLFPITYYESNSYVVNKNLNIDGLISIISNKKLIKKGWGNNRIVDTDYDYAFYIGNFICEEISLNKPVYISYYPNSKINNYD
jgi:hypothetical protein